MDIIYRYDPFQPIVINRPANTDSAIQTLLAGNRRLVSLVQKMQQVTLGDDSAEPTVISMNPISRGLPLWSGAALDQKPFVLVLGCSDARVPIESIFDQTFNEMFVVRIAGNILGTECVGSFDYAVRNLGGALRAIVVLGHTGCGAVTAAVDSYLAPNEYADISFSHCLRTLVDRVMISVRGAAKSIERRYGPSIAAHPNYRAAMIDVAVYLNSAITAYDLRRELHISANSSLDVFYGVCDLKTMLVTSSPVISPDTEPDLRSAPRDAANFVELGNQLVENLTAAGMLGNVGVA